MLLPLYAVFACWSVKGKIKGLLTLWCYIIHRSGFFLHAFNYYLISLVLCILAGLVNTIVLP